MVPASEHVLVVIDEIGKMECYSRLFQDTLIRILDSGNPVLGSIALIGNSFIEGIKKRKDILLIRVLGNNRDTLFEKYSAMLSE